MNNRYLGIDVAQKTLAVCLLEEPAPLHAEFANTPAGHKKLLRWLEHRVEGMELWVGMEATGRYYEAVATACHGAGYRVSVLNPARVAFYAHSRLSRSKQDHVDSRLIAQFLKSEQPHLWEPTPSAYYELQELVRRLDDLKAMRLQEHNRLKAGITSPTVQASLQHHLDLLDQQIAQLEQDIYDHIERDPDLKLRRDLLDSIPRIAHLTAAKLLGELGDLTRFASAQAVTAYVGLCPQHHESGIPSANAPVSVALGTAVYARHSISLPSLRCATIPFSKPLPTVSLPTKSPRCRLSLPSCANYCILLLASSSPIVLLIPILLAHRHAALTSTP